LLKTAVASLALALTMSLGAPCQLRIPHLPAASPAPQPSAPAAAVTAPAAAVAAPGTSQLFTSAGAAWLYNPPSGSGLNISGMVQGLTVQVNTHDQGFDYPVQYADGSLGCTTFTDTLYYQFNDRICVPNPAGGFHPSVGGWGANDGHLIVINAATRTYYDFWKLMVDANGQPTSTNVGQVVSGSLDASNGTPGTTAATISGLAGDIMPGELDCATCLQHALNVVVPSVMNSNLVSAQAPAAKTDGQVYGAIFREGAKLRFDPAVNVDTLPVSTAVKAILHALQNYGAVITDQTGGTSIGFYSALAVAPDLTGLDQVKGHLSLYF